jgi:hypothetical protein
MATPDQLSIAGASAIEQQFARSGEPALALLDQQGAPIAPAANHTLHRVAEPPALGAGDYVAEHRYVADAATTSRSARPAFNSPSP